MSQSSYISFLFDKVDNRALILFRIVFGLLAFLESVGAILTGWVKEVMIDPVFTFSFIGLGWLQPLPGDGMYYYYIIMGVLGFMMMIGFRYRIAALGFFVMWFATYLMQKTHYNNHYYLMVWMSLIMALIPAHANYSIDSKRGTTARTFTCERWILLLFVFQVSVVYFFAAIAKLNPDWLSLRPVGLWFPGKTDYPIIGPLFETEWLKWLIAYGGVGFDMVIAPLLLWRRTRLVAFGVSVFFHLFNSATFQIGIFPYMMIGISVFFFPPESLKKLFFKRREVATTVVASNPMSIRQKGVALVLAIFFTIQLILPIRHWFIEGDVNWTEEGHRMAWRMMLRTKSGHIHFIVKDNLSGETKKVFPNEYLSKDQANQVAKSPDMVWQFVQYLKQLPEIKGKDASIYAKSLVSLNGHPPQALVDPKADLARVEWNYWGRNEWVTLPQFNDDNN